jgi:flagellin
MNINTLLNSVSATLAQQSTPVSVKFAAPVTSATPGSTVQANGAASYTSPSQSVVQNAGLLSASSNFAQLGTLLEVAQSGTQQVGDILQQLVSLAEQVPQTNDLTGLDSEFSQLITQIDQTVSGTTFGGKGLLGGVFSSDGSDPASTNGDNTSPLSLPDLSVSGLFGSNTPNISTPAAAVSALAVLSTAQDTVGSASAEITGVLGQLSFASASVGTALSNNDAAASTLNESDLTDGSALGAFAGFFGSPAATAQAQTGNLPANLLSLLQE